MNFAEAPHDEPAGAAAAVFLSRAGVEPLLLEAGSSNAPLGLTARVRGLTVAKVKRSSATYARAACEPARSR